MGERERDVQESGGKKIPRTYPFVIISSLSFLETILIELTLTIVAINPLEVLFQVYFKRVAAVKVVWSPRAQMTILEEVVAAPTSL